MGPISHQLELPRELSGSHNTFHTSKLKKRMSNESLVISLEEIQVDDKLNYVEEQVEIMDHEVKQLKQSRIPIIKFQWNSQRGTEFTWEHEDQISKQVSAPLHQHQSGRQLKLNLGTKFF
ncbi:hypothetical protein Tco_1499335 [Tanacetum coccineum]